MLGISNFLFPFFFFFTAFAAQELPYERGCSIPGDQAPLSLNTCSASSHAICLFVIFCYYLVKINLTLLLSVKIEQEACQKSYQSQWTVKNEWIIQRR